MDNYKYYTPQIHLNIIKALLQILCQIFEQNNITYFLEGGSLLGAVRHGDIIPWDDDADLGVLENDFDKLCQILPQCLKDVALQIGEKPYPLFFEKSSSSMLKVYVQNLWATTEANRIIATPTIDLFKYRSKNNKIELYSVMDRQRFPKCYFTTEEFYPLKEYPFGSFVVKGANNGVPYLKRYYGDDCLVKGKIDIRSPNAESMLNKIKNSTIEFNIDQNNQLQ